MLSGFLNATGFEIHIPTRLLLEILYFLYVHFCGLNVLCFYKHTNNEAITLVDFLCGYHSSQIVSAFSCWTANQKRLSCSLTKTIQQPKFQYNLLIKCRPNFISKCKFVAESISISPGRSTFFTKENTINETINCVETLLRCCATKKESACSWVPVDTNSKFCYQVF